MTQRAILFDWDGTLVDSAATSYRCFTKLFGSFGIRFEPADFARTYSPAWYRTYAAVGLAETEWEEADRRWMAFYRQESSRLIRGAREALERLNRHDRVQGLVTSGNRERVHAELSALDVSQYFQVVICAEDSRNKKPHPEALLLALERLKLAPEQAIYIGDSPEDIAMARAAAVRSIGIPGGFPNREQLLAARPDFLADDLAQAVDVLLDGEA
ncbi:MAG TPA: HAD family hydrolase [Acidobacteriota bacterium]